MKANELKQLLKNGALNKYECIYADISAQSKRLIDAIDKFTSLYGDERDIEIFSVSGRSEISGNHTDHNKGCVLAGAIDRDIIAIAARNEDGVVRYHSEGYPETVIDLSMIDDADNFKPFTSSALIAGMARGFALEGYSIGGFDAYSNTEVLKGSGLSSSAAFEVMVGNVMNHLYNDGKVENIEIAKLAQYAENVFFKKPCGLMDQMACAVGGFVYIDFENPERPIVEPINFSLTEKGYSLCIVNTGGNHANLNDDYASVPAEMKGVAALLGKDVLRGVSEKELIKKIPEIRETLGDRAILRAIHFIRENERVSLAKEALVSGNLESFFDTVIKSGKSSFEYLQNVYTTLNVKEQGLSLALCLAEGFLKDKGGAYRVHGGGFAGTVQIFVKNEYTDELVALMDSVFGTGAAMKLRIRPIGAAKLTL